MAPSRHTIPEILSLRSQELGHLEALVTEDQSITYEELDHTSNRIAGRLLAAGVQKGSRVGLIMPNGIPWAEVAFGAMRIGAVLVPLSTLLRPPELLTQLRVSAATHLIMVESHRRRRYFDDLEEIAPGIGSRHAVRDRHPAIPSLLNVWDSDALPDSSVDAKMVRATELAVRPSDDMAIMFTSGSRATPKGVIHTHANALRAVAAGLDSRRVSQGERLYIPMPFFWMGGFAGGLLTALVAGATLLSDAATDPEGTLQFLERQRATLFRGWPDQAARIATSPAFPAANLSRLRPASLGAVLPEALRGRPGARANLFGMTESFGPYCGAPLDQDLPSPAFGSCGQVFDGIEIEIRGPNSDTPLAAGEIGEIHLRGPNLMRGICGRTRSEVFGNDGYFATGDLGSLNVEGYLFYEGRLDDMFKVKGATVYPSEVEAALRTIPGVRAAHVTNVWRGVGSEEVGALLVLAEQRPLEAIITAASAQLSAFKVPTVWRLASSVEEIPLSTTGKVDKSALQRLLSDEATAD